jgi:hypothetical protein
MGTRNDSMHPSGTRDKGLLVGGLVVAAAAGLFLWFRGEKPALPELVRPAQAPPIEDGVALQSGGDHALERTVMEAPPLEDAVPAPLAQGTSSKSPFEGPDATEALRAHRLSELERNWERVAVARERDHEGDLLRVSALILAGMKPILDEAGLGEQQVGTRTEYPKDEHHLFINGLDYFVPHGQFPVVDRYYQLWQEWSARSEAARAIDPFAQVPFVLDEPFLVSLEAMKNLAAEALARRTELY